MCIELYIWTGKCIYESVEIKKPFQIYNPLINQLTINISSNEI